MTTSLPVFDFSTTPEERANEQAKIDAAIASAEKAMKEAPAVKAVKAKLVKLADAVIPVAVYDSKHLACLEWHLDNVLVG